MGLNQRSGLPKVEVLLYTGYAHSEGVFVGYLSRSQCKPKIETKNEVE